MKANFIVSPPVRRRLVHVITIAFVYTGLRCLSETPQVFKLRTYIQQGDWSGARNELEEMQFESGEIGKAR